MRSERVDVLRPSNPLAKEYTLSYFSYSRLPNVLKVYP